MKFLSLLSCLFLSLCLCFATGCASSTPPTVSETGVPSVGAQPESVQLAYAAGERRTVSRRADQVQQSGLSTYTETRRAQVDASTGAVVRDAAGNVVVEEYYAETTWNDPREIAQVGALTVELNTGGDSGPRGYDGVRIHASNVDAVTQNRGKIDAQGEADARRIAASGDRAAAALVAFYSGESQRIEARGKAVVSIVKGAQEFVGEVVSLTNPAGAAARVGEALVATLKRDDGSTVQVPLDPPAVEASQP